jgi:hypothetical protein
MGSIAERTRKDGSRAYMAQIAIKKDGKIVHREAETFDRKQAANAWIVKPEAQLKRPGGLERKEDPTLSAVIDRYIAESKNAVLGAKAQVLRTIKNSDLGEIKCSDIKLSGKGCGVNAVSFRIAYLIATISIPLPKRLGHRVTRDQVVEPAAARRAGVGFNVDHSPVLSPHRRRRARAQRRLCRRATSARGFAGIGIERLEPPPRAGLGPAAVDVHFVLG